MRRGNTVYRQEERTSSINQFHAINAIQCRKYRSTAQPVTSIGPRRNGGGKEMVGDGRRWKERGGDGRRWEQLGADERRWKKVEEDGRRWKKVEGDGGR